jgi:hypothetical protein
VWKEKKETLERKREGVYSKLLFNLSKPFIVEIKHCVLYPLSVSKPPPVVSPTNMKEKIPLFIATKNGKEEIVLEIMKKNPDATNSSLTRKEHIPLFIATMNGIEEIVWEIINQYPHAVEHLNEEGQSILDVAVKHRQKNIFSLVKHQKIPLARLHRVVDKKGNTLLHHVADMEHYRGGTKPGPALKLQEELQWFEVRPFHPFVFTS